MPAASIRETIKSTPVLGEFTSNAARRYRNSRFPGSAEFWERHYAAGRGSSPESVGHLAAFTGQCSASQAKGEASSW